MSRPPPPSSDDRPQASDPGWWGHLRVLAWGALFLAAIELLLEVRAYRRGWDTLVFGKAVAGDSEQERGFGPTAEFPFRSRVVASERAPGTLRVWIASASYALGGNLPPEEIFAVRLGDLLGRAGQPTEVLNAGRVAYALPQSVAALEEGAPRWRPDVAVLYHLSTDVDEISRLLLGRGGLAAGAGAAGQDWGARLVERTTVQPLLKEHVASRLTRLRPLADTLEPGGAAEFESRVRAFVTACRRLGVRPVLCTFATSHDRADPRPLPSHVFRFNFRVSRQGWHDTVDLWNDLIRRVAREEGAALVDVAAALLGQGRHFVDFVHFSATGHGVVARLLAPAVAPGTELPPAPPEGATPR